MSSHSGVHILGVARFSAFLVRLVYAPGVNHIDINARPSYGSDHELRMLVIIAGAGGGVFTLLTWLIVVTGSVPLAVDSAVHGWMRSIEWDPLSAVARGITALGDSPTVWIIAGVLALALACARRWWAASILGLGMALDIGLVRAGKTMVTRARPDDLISSGFGTSFPSGHSAYGIVWVVLGIIATRSIPRLRTARWPIVVGVVLGVLIPLSRVYLRPHWITDAVAGAAVGCVAFSLVAIAVVTATRA